MNEIDKSLKSVQGKRISEFRAFLGKTQSDFANDIEIDRAYLAQIETGTKSLSHKVLTNVTNSYKSLNTDWLLNGIGPMIKTSDVEIININEKPNVKFLNIAAFAGYAIGHENYEVEKWIYIPGLDNRQDHYGIVVDGNSMIPTLNHGDFIICSPVINIAEDFKHGNVYVTVLRDRVVVKRLFIKEGNIQLISDNPFFKPEIVDQEDIIKLFAITTRVTPFSS